MSIFPGMRVVVRDHSCYRNFAATVDSVDHETGEALVTIARHHEVHMVCVEDLHPL